MGYSLHIGDLFASLQPALGHGVNIYGVMGAGVAALFRRNFPEIFPPYAKACADNTLNPGDNLPVEVTSVSPSGKTEWVFNIASQDLPGRHARMDWLEMGVEDAFVFCEKNNIPGLAIPRIGVGIGGLQWVDVKAKLIEISERHPNINFEVWVLPQEATKEDYLEAVN